MTTDPPPGTSPEDWEWVPCPCIKTGPVYDNTGPDLDGSPVPCGRCEGTGEVPAWLLEATTDE